MMSSNSRRSSASSVFWPADDVDSRSSMPSSAAQPVIDAGKQRRFASTLDESSQASQRSALGDALFRQLSSTSSPTTTVLSPPRVALPQLLPGKYEVPRIGQANVHDHSGRHSVSVPFRPTWTCAGADSRSDSVSNDSSTYWRRGDDDEGSRRHGVEIYGTVRRRSSQSSSRGVASHSTATCPSKIGHNAGSRGRPWISKYLEQFTEKNDDGEWTMSMPRRRGSVAALVDSFEQCALEYGTLDNRHATTLPHGGPGRRTIHGSLTNLNSVGTARGWSGGSSAVDSGGGATPLTACTDIISTKSPPIIINQPVSPPKSSSERFRILNTRRDRAEVDREDANAIRRFSSVDVVRRALHGSLTNLDSVARSHTGSSSSEKTAAENGIIATQPIARTDFTSTKSPTFTSSHPRLKSYSEYIKTLKVGNDRARFDENANASRPTRRSSNVNVIKPAASCEFYHSVSFNTKSGPPIQPYQQRRLSMLVGKGCINNTEGGSESTPLAADTRREVPSTFTDSRNQQETGQSCDVHVGDGSSQWVGRPESESLPAADTQRVRTVSSWVQKSVPPFSVVDDGGDFASAFWKYRGGTWPLRRTGSIVSDSNNTEDSGVSSSEHTATSSTADWSRCDQEVAQQNAGGGGWLRSGSKSGPAKATYRNEEDAESSSAIIDYRSPSSQDRSGINSAQFKSTLHGIYCSLSILLLC